MAKRIEGVYAITPECDGVGELEDMVGAALAGGVRLVQYRNKRSGVQRRFEQANMLMRLAREAGATLIVNDDPWLAAQCGAHGVHLGREDAGLAAAREAVGTSAMIGVSCYASLSRAVQMQAAGADYVAFGSFFASRTKPGAVSAPLALLSEAAGVIRLPIVAIGGIGPDNAAAVLQAGASAIAVISSLFGARDIAAAARRLVGIAAEGAASRLVQLR
jgi:thiamine-phosphate pyrophosphorylase